MEEIKKLLNQSNIDITSSSDSENDNETEISIGIPKLNHETKATKEIAKGNRKSGVARLPTRRPDPNVYNRNALLARENRRKKKAYLEAVEKELEEARSTNTSLVKALKKQSKMFRKLQKENQLLRATLGKQKSHSGAVRCISPVGSLGSYSHYSSSGSSTFDPDSACPQSESDKNNGSVTQQHIESPTSAWSNFCDAFFTDYQPTATYDSTWNDLLNENCFQLIEKESAEEETDHDICGVNEDHSYFKGYLTSEQNTNSELSLNITSGRVSSLDDPISPQWSASGTPPVQLLQLDDDMDYTTTAWIKKLFGKMRRIVKIITCMVPKFTSKLRPTPAANLKYLETCLSWRIFDKYQISWNKSLKRDFSKGVNKNT